MTITETFPMKVKRVRTGKNPKYFVYRATIPHDKAEAIGLKEEDYVLATVQKAEWYHLLKWDEMANVWPRLPGQLQQEIMVSGLPEARNLRPTSYIPLRSYIPGGLPSGCEYCQLYSQFGVTSTPRGSFVPTLTDKKPTDIQSSTLPPSPIAGAP